MFTADDSLVLLALLTAGLALIVIAEWIRIPYPIVLVLGGLAIGFVPGIPLIELPPDLVLVVVLPPLLYGTAFFTSLREFRANIRPIALLAFGLVLLTMVAVAAVAHTVVPGLSWPCAFVLGAIVSPTDPTAATAIAQRLGLPRSLVSLIEGESLVNDGTALVAYKYAVAAVVTGAFSFTSAAGDFALNVAAGIGIGLGVGFVIRQVRLRIENPPVEITISILSGYLAYLPAEAADVSGVLAVVTAGIYLGWHTLELTSAQTRLQGIAVWEILFLVLNALLFVLVGLQLPVILDELGSISIGSIVAYAAIVTAVVIGVRLLWVFPVSYLPRIRRRDVLDGASEAPWKGALIVGWAGMRGAVSLAAALALPLTIDTGSAFPDRELIIFLTFSVILGTLVLQGLTLPGLIRVLRLPEDGLADKEEAKARIHAAEAALARLDELVEEDWVLEDTAERVRGMFTFRRERFRSRFDPDGDGGIEDRSASYRRLLRELLDAERDAVLELQRSGRIDDEVMRRVVRDLDLEEARLR
jgi:monovalent cation/hydrogen antiporter